MKIAVIGNNRDVAQFIKNSKIIDDYTKADVVVFSGDLNWRSAVQKFNKISPNKLVIVIDTNVDLFVKKYDGKTYDCRLKHPNQTNPVILLKDNILTEAFVNINKLICFKAGRKYISLEHTKLNYGYLDKVGREYIQKNKCTLVTVAEKENMPKCMFIQVNPNIIRDSDISQYLNKLICEYTNIQ